MIGIELEEGYEVKRRFLLKFLLEAFLEGVKEGLQEMKEVLRIG